MSEVNFKAFSGLRNDVSAERFGPDDLEAAVNVDLDDTGRLSRRDGYISKLAGSNVHSLWSAGDMCLFVDNGAMKRLHPNYTTATLRTGIGDSPVSYVAVNGRVYYSNGLVTGVVDDYGSRGWGIEVPGLPSASQAGGSLPEGSYQFVLTYVREDGQESGAGLAGLINVSGGIAFSQIPVSSDPTVSHKILYMTTQNGDVLYRASVLANDTISYTWTGGALSIPLSTQYLEPAPVGEIVAYHYGTLYVASGSNVFYSSPFGYELFDPRAYLAFDSHVQIFAPTEGGVWVGTQKEISWLAGGEPDKFQKSDRISIGSLKGTLAYMTNDSLPETKLANPDAKVALWWTDEGVVAGYPSGTLAQLTRQRYRPTITGERGSGLVRKTGNTLQYMSLINH